MAGSPGGEQSLVVHIQGSKLGPIQFNNLINVYNNEAECTPKKSADRTGRSVYKYLKAGCPGILWSLHRWRY